MDPVCEGRLATSPCKRRLSAITHQVETLKLGRLRQLLAAHPGFELYILRPILKGGYATQVFAHMLFADVSNRNIFALAIPNRHTEYALGEENPLCMMT